MKINVNRVESWFEWGKELRLAKKWVRVEVSILFSVFSLKNTKNITFLPTPSFPSLCPHNI